MIAAQLSGLCVDLRLVGMVSAVLRVERVTPVDNPYKLVVFQWPGW